MYFPRQNACSDNVLPPTVLNENRVLISACASLPLMQLIVGKWLPYVTSTINLNKL